MSTDVVVVARPPTALTEPELRDFLAMVRAGGEVEDAVLENNVRSAEFLVVGHRASCLVAVAALKNPKTSYRERIHVKTGVLVDAQRFPFELGYIFVLPSARRGGIGRKACDAALSQVEGKGVFATVRTNNYGMHRILAECGFATAGKPYASRRRDRELQLFLRSIAEPSVGARTTPTAHG